MLILGTIVLALLLAACRSTPAPTSSSAASKPGAPAQSQPAQGEPAAKVAGDANTGKTLLTTKGCIACHTAAGVDGAVGTIGPSLNGIGNATSRPKLADGEANTAASIRGWIKSPNTKKPGTLMPNLGLSDKEADDLTAFLVTLR